MDIGITDRHYYIFSNSEAGEISLQKITCTISIKSTGMSPPSNSEFIVLDHLADQPRGTPTLGVFYWP
jgi:hypothetical protein